MSAESPQRDPSELILNSNPMETKLRESRNWSEAQRELAQVAALRDDLSVFIVRLYSIDLDCVPDNIKKRYVDLRNRCYRLSD